MAQRAAEVIASGAYTKPEVIAEVVYVLKSVYSTPKDKIKSIIRGLSDIIRIENSDCVVHAIDLFPVHHSTLLIAVLIAYHSLTAKQFSLSTKN